MSEVASWPIASVAVIQQYGRYQMSAFATPVRQPSTAVAWPANPFDFLKMAFAQAPVGSGPLLQIENRQVVMFFVFARHTQ